MTTTLEHKIVMYGNYGVGKTSLVTRFLGGNFTENTTSTLGASFLYWRPEGKNARFGIWDTAGQERFNALLPIYLRDASVILYCWDSSVPFNTETATTKYNEARFQCPLGYIYLVLTKVDFSMAPRGTSGPEQSLGSAVRLMRNQPKAGSELFLRGDSQNPRGPDDSIVIAIPDAEKWARDNDIKYFYTSAKTGQGIQELFSFIYESCSTKKYAKDPQTIILGIPPRTRRFGRCCGR